MSANSYKELKKHEGHKIVCVSYKCQMPNGTKVYNVALECETCNEVLLDYDKGGGELTMYPKIEKMIKKYFLDECLMIKLTGESDKDYDAEFIIDMDDFYLKTSFIAYKKDVEKWKKDENSR